MISVIFDYDQEVVLDKDIYHAKKSTVFTVCLPVLNAVERPNSINKDFIVSGVTEHLFTNNLMLKNVMKKLGLNCGSWRVTPFAGYPSSQVIANQNLSVLKIIGLIKYPMRILTILSLNTFYLMAPTFTKRAVS